MNRKMKMQRQVNMKVKRKCIEIKKVHGENALR